MQPALEVIIAGLVGDCWQAEPILGGQSGSRVWRVTPATGHPLIVKTLRPEDVVQHLREDYPAIAESEYRFYTEAVPRLGLPAPEWFRSGVLADGTRYLVLEDLAHDHVIPPEGHIWTNQELQSVMRTYGLLHGRSLRLLSEEAPPPWLHADPRTQFDPASVIDCMEAFAANPWTAEQAAPVAGAPGLHDLTQTLASRLSTEPPVLLYNDFWPCNVAIPKEGGPAKLFDWQLVGAGPMQIDIVNIGLLGRDEAFAHVDRGALLDLYLDTFAAEAGYRPETAAFRLQCGYATLLGWALFLPRMVKAMKRCNAEGRQFSPWMATTFQNCMLDWQEALSQ